jgi:hypothetical protein
MLARASGAIMSSIAVIPGTESLHPGLRCAALVVLLLDVLTETVGRFAAVSRAIRKSLRIQPVRASENANGELALNFGVILRSMPKLPKLRITGRIVSAMLIAAQWLGDLQPWHTELLVIAISVLTMDVFTEIVSRFRTRVERWLNDLKSHSDSNEGR